MNQFTLVIINQQFIRIISSKFPSSQILNCLFLKNFISTSLSSYRNYALKIMPLSSHDNDINPNWDQEFGRQESGTERPFYVSTGGVSPSDREVTPGQKKVFTVRKYETLGDHRNASGGNKGVGVPLRVMNYNVLSQVLLEEHHYLYRRQPPEILAWNYRSQLIFQEILTVNPDVSCEKL